MELGCGWLSLAHHYWLIMKAWVLAPEPTQSPGVVSGVYSPSGEEAETVLKLAGESGYALCELQVWLEILSQKVGGG